MARVAMSMERRVMQFMGAYTDLQDTMQFLVYAHLSDEERGSFIKKNPDDRILDNFKKLFRQKLNVYVPEQIPDTYNGARPVSQRPPPPTGDRGH